MSWPGLPTWKMHTPATHVVDGDLRELPDQLAKRYASQLQQWRKRDKKQKLQREWLSPVQMAILAVHGLFRGLRPVDAGAHLLGCGIQVSAEGWARRLGCKERAVTKAFTKLKEMGLLERWRQLVPCEWKGKRQHRRADVRGVSYLTDAGAKWLAEHAGATKRLVVHSTWERGGVQRRVLVASGLVGKLLETLRSKLKRLAHRLSPQIKQDRPEAEDRYEKRRTETERSSPVGNALGRSVSRLTPAPSNPGENPAVAGNGGDLTKAEAERLEQLWRAQRLDPSTGWPKLWKEISNMPDGALKNARYRWVVRECEHWAQRFSKLELQRALERKGCSSSPVNQESPARRREWKLIDCVWQFVDVDEPSTNSHTWSEYE